MRRIYGFGMIMFLFISACSPGGATSTPMGPDPTITPLPSMTAIPTLIPTATIAPPDGLPETGFTNVYGRVLWKSEPVEAITISLIVSVPGEPIYFEDAETDSNGRFVFTKVPASDIGQLMIFSQHLKAIFGEEWSNVVDAVPAFFSVPENTNFNFGEYYLVTKNLTLLHPIDGVELSESVGSLEWEPYPDAAFYHITLNQQRGSYTNLEMDTEATQLALLPLLDCQYTWVVVAYDFMGNPLAKSRDEDGSFTIKNDMLPRCNLEIISPLYMEEITSGVFQIEWELHPLAVRYEINIIKHFGYVGADTEWYRGSVIVEADGSISEPSPAIPKFETDSYHLIISAYTADDGFIASGASPFFVP